MFVSFGRRVCTSIAIARNVFTSEMASAPASSAALRERGDVGDVRRQLRDDRKPRHLADRADHVVRARQAAAEGDAAFLDVRARDVQLERVHALGVGQDARHLDVLVERRPADVHDDDRAAIAQLREALFHETVDADALQPDGVEHARRRFDDARRGVSFALGQEQALHGDAAERGEIDDVGVLDAVAEAAAGGDQRIRERERPNLNGQIHQCPDTASQTTRCASNTGPSMQVRV